MKRQTDADGNAQRDAPLERGAIDAPDPVRVALDERPVALHRAHRAPEAGAREILRRIALACVEDPLDLGCVYGVPSVTERNFASAVFTRSVRSSTRLRR